MKKTAICIVAIISILGVFYMDSGIRTAGITKLSELEIDVAKNWAGKKIENLGAPDSLDDAVKGTVSLADTTVYVDKEATGAGDGTSWTDAFTTIQAAVNSLPTIIAHTYTIKVRHGTKKTGTADANVLNKLHDTGEFPATTTWVGRRVFNVGGTGPGDNWGVVSARESDDQLSIVDIAGAALDLFPNGNEDYVIEPTPYRETVYLNSDPDNHPPHLILGRETVFLTSDPDNHLVIIPHFILSKITIEAEYYWPEGDCEANVGGAGEITDTGAFADVEVGDRVYVLDLNGADDRAQDYEVCTVDDISNAPDRIGTNGVKTPSTNWKYVIVKTEISGSDDGVDSGTARNNLFLIRNIADVWIWGFYMTFADTFAIDTRRAPQIVIDGCFLEYCDYGIAANDAVVMCYRTYISVDADNAYAYYLVYSRITTNYNTSRTAKAGTDSRICYCFDNANFWYERGILDNAHKGIRADKLTLVSLSRVTILNTVDTGLYARENSCIRLWASTNSATTPEDPAATSEGAYIAS